MKKFLLLVSVVFFCGTALAQNVPTLELFYGAECPHCHKELEWLPTLAKQYPELKIEKYETWHNEENSKLFKAKMAELGQEAQGVPTNIIDGQAVVGFSDEQKTKILNIVEQYYGKPVEIDANDERATPADGEHVSAALTNTQKMLFGGGVLLILILGAVLFTRKKDA